MYNSCPSRNRPLSSISIVRVGINEIVILLNFLNNVNSDISLIIVIEYN